jgi:antitoxin (DNA-binding transcriptional repressor) of toxin-antitoxin stability system
MMVHVTRTISQAELRNGSAGVMDALEAGEHFVITRNGVPVGELRPLRRRIDLSAEQLVRAFAHLTSGDSVERMRAEADAIFGSDRIGGD